MAEKTQFNIPLLMVNAEPKRERRDAVENRERILETAVSLFAEQGVHTISMADIAKAAGVGKGTLYRRFANKGELCLALMDTQMRDFQNDSFARMQQSAIDGVPPLTQLTQFIDSLIYFTEAHAPLLCEVQREGMLDGLSDERAQLPHFWQHMTVSGLLKTAVFNNQLSPTIDIEYTADALLAPLKADIFRFQRTVRGFSLERISAGLQQLIMGLSHIDIPESIDRSIVG
jgi:AcrR family transcriptional regulator